MADGGYVYSRTGYISASSTASGSVTVTGPDSQWVNATSLYVAQSGEGRLTIANSGLVRVGGILGVFGSKGAVNLATGGMLALSGDADDSLSQFLGLVQGTDAIRYWNDTLAAWAPLTSATFGVDYTLEYQITGDLAGYTLLTVGTLPVLDGDFNVDGVVDAADYTVWRDGLDTIYTQADYDLWKANFGNTYPEFPAAALAPNSVPEPSTVWLGALCVAVAHRGIRGRMGMHQGCLSRP